MKVLNKNNVKPVYKAREDNTASPQILRLKNDIEEGHILPDSDVVLLETEPPVLAKPIDIAIEASNLEVFSYLWGKKFFTALKLEDRIYSTKQAIINGFTGRYPAVFSKIIQSFALNELLYMLKTPDFVVDLTAISTKGWADKIQLHITQILKCIQQKIREKKPMEYSTKLMFDIMTNSMIYQGHFNRSLFFCIRSIILAYSECLSDLKNGDDNPKYKKEFEKFTTMLLKSDRMIFRMVHWKIHRDYLDMFKTLPMKAKEEVEEYLDNSSIVNDALREEVGKLCMVRSPK